MSSAQIERDQMERSVTAIGGIDDTDVTFQAGVTILAGRNASNRISLLQALMVALGSDAVSLKDDTDERHIELTVGDETYTRTYPTKRDCRHEWRSVSQG
jgi:predicted ATPase